MDFFITIFFLSGCFGRKGKPPIIIEFNCSFIGVVLFSISLLNQMISLSPQNLHATRQGDLHLTADIMWFDLFFCECPGKLQRLHLPKTLNIILGVCCMLKIKQLARCITELGLQSLEKEYLRIYKTRIAFTSSKSHVLCSLDSDPKNNWYLGEALTGQNAIKNIFFVMTLGSSFFASLPVFTVHRFYLSKSHNKEQDACIIKSDSLLHNLPRIWSGCVNQEQMFLHPGVRKGSGHWMERYWMFSFGTMCFQMSCSANYCILDL